MSQGDRFAIGGLGLGGGDHHPIDGREQYSFISDLPDAFRFYQAMGMRQVRQYDEYFKEL